MHSRLLFLFVTCGVSIIGSAFAFLQHRGWLDEKERVVNKILGPLLSGANLVGYEGGSDTKNLYLSSGITLTLVYRYNRRKRLDVVETTTKRDLATIWAGNIAPVWECKIEKMIKQWKTRELENKMEQAKIDIIQSLDATKEKLQNAKGGLTTITGR